MKTIEEKIPIPVLQKNYKLCYSVVMREEVGGGSQSDEAYV